MGQGIKPADSFQDLVLFSTHIYIYCQPNFAHLGRSTPSHEAIYFLSAGGIQNHHAMGHVILNTQLTKSRWPLPDATFIHCLLRQMSMSLPGCKESLPEEKNGKGSHFHQCCTHWKTLLVPQMTTTGVAILQILLKF